jgi:hypothetical protein
MAETTKQVKPKRGRPCRTEAAPPMGYTAAARLVGCSVSHLWYVLNTDRGNERKRRDYRKMIAGGGR